MLEVIENLLVLQDRDRKIASTRSELSDIGPQRQMLQGKQSDAQSALDAAKLKGKQIETERKKLELEVESKKQQIERYALQQFQTKKNEEYRALKHEIDLCQEAIVKLDDQQLEFMEQAETIQKEVVRLTGTAAELRRVLDERLQALDQREVSLKQYLAELELDRNKLAEAVEERALNRYQRLANHKEGNVVVGIVNGVCSGCHMKLPMQVVVSCQSEEGLVDCINCARILYYTRDISAPVTA